MPDRPVSVGLDFLFIVRPHAQDANRFFFAKDLIHDAVLNIDATRVCAGKIADQFFKGRWIFSCLIALLFLAWWIVVDTRKRLMKAVLRQVASNGLKIWTAFCVILHSATKAMKVFCKTMEKEFLSF